MRFEFTFTYDEFVEASRAQQRLRRTSSGAQITSPWVGCAMIGMIFLVLLVCFVLAAMLHAGTRSGADSKSQSNGVVAEYFAATLPFPLVAGGFWLVLARSSANRRLLRDGVIGIILAGLLFSLTHLLGAPEEGPTTQPETTGWTPFLPVIIVLMFVILFLAKLRQSLLRTSWEEHPYLRGPLTGEASEESLSIAADVCRMQYSWEAFRSFSETRNLFLLSLSALQFHAVPKRAFVSEGEMQAFRELLYRKVAPDAAPRNVTPMTLPP